jgi:hypothetical protein
MRGSAPTGVKVLAAGLLAVIAGVHFQQYVDFMSEVPTIGVLFLLTAAGGAGLAVALLALDRLVRILAALGGAVMAIAALVSIAIALSGHLFGYQEPTLRVPVVLAIVAEVLVLPVLAVVLRRELRPSVD